MDTFIKDWLYIPISGTFLVLRGESDSIILYREAIPKFRIMTVKIITLGVATIVLAG